MISCCTTVGSWVAHTISNLDLNMRVALGDVLYASNDFRHSRNAGKGVAWGQEGCSDLLVAPKPPEQCVLSMKRPTY